ncbi:hypothetical protein PHLGIDRAFT_249890 [Phlebiopsis gigantea 11061_1 CR5-6]|uniref:Uncharacterized protein n=1 Tax=Phlebiopsis gigantea (strain 11061_1 CR5-6) TaxID=745531 RepID=A0A0C3SE94_PHLG1|nr:hypothetical protein PHLGIDRAFT_249890 [Phlebiopsis gigantea 11061_1 CR5-6]
MKSREEVLREAHARLCAADAAFIQAIRELKDQMDTVMNSSQMDAGGACIEPVRDRRVYVSRTQQCLAPLPRLQLTLPQPTPSQPALSQSASSQPIPSQPIPSQPIPSQPIPSQPIPSQLAPSAAPSRPLPTHLALSQHNITHQTLCQSPLPEIAPSRPTVAQPTPSQPASNSHFSAPHQPAPSLMHSRPSQSTEMYMVAVSFVVGACLIVCIAVCAAPLQDGSLVKQAFNFGLAVLVVSGLELAFILAKIAFLRVVY